MFIVLPGLYEYIDIDLIINFIDIFFIRNF